MSKPINDAQLYALLSIRHDTPGAAISEIRGMPTMVGTRLGVDQVYYSLVGGFDIVLLRGLATRGYIHSTTRGLWRITEAGQFALTRPSLMKRIANLVRKTAEYQKDLNERSARGEDL